MTAKWKGGANVANDLKQQHKDFAEYFLECGNQTEAYKRAYPGCKSDGAAGVNGNRLLKNAKVKQYIEKRQKELDSKKIAGADEVLEFLTKVMRGEEKDAFGLDTGIADRNKAAELLGKRYCLFKEQVEVKNINIADTLKKARERATKNHGS